MDEAVQWATVSIKVPGELNYLISRVLAQHQDGYHDMSAWRAAVIDAAEEYYRRVMAPYEDRKCKENGDVYE